MSFSKALDLGQRPLKTSSTLSRNPAHNANNLFSHAQHSPGSSLRGANLFRRELRRACGRQICSTLAQPAGILPERPAGAFLTNFKGDPGIRAYSQRKMKSERLGRTGSNAVRSRRISRRSFRKTGLKLVDSTASCRFSALIARSRRVWMHAGCGSEAFRMIHTWPARFSLLRSFRKTALSNVFPRSSIFSRRSPRAKACNTKSTVFPSLKRSPRVS